MEEVVNLVQERGQTLLNRFIRVLRTIAGCSRRRSAGVELRAGARHGLDGQHSSAPNERHRPQFDRHDCPRRRRNPDDERESAPGADDLPQHPSILADDETDTEGGIAIKDV
jgi:hypothetical protein